MRSSTRLGSKSHPSTSADLARQVTTEDSALSIVRVPFLLWHDELTPSFLYLLSMAIGKKSKTLGRTGGYIKAIPDITAALERGTIEGVPLFLMGHSYVSLFFHGQFERSRSIFLEIVWSFVHPSSAEMALLCMDPAHNYYCF